MKNILVGIDFDEHTSKLINHAYKLAEKFNSKVWLLHAAAPAPDFIGYDVGPQYIRDSRADELRKEHKELQRLAQGLISKGIEADGLLIQGATIDTIIAESKTLNIDLLIIGNHDHSFIYKVFFDNKPSEIINKSNIPVLMIPLGKNV